MQSTLFPHKYAASFGPYNDWLLKRSHHMYLHSHLLARLPPAVVDRGIYICRLFIEEAIGWLFCYLL